jgi:ribose transport system substrate-binding protein
MAISRMSYKIAPIALAAVMLALSACGSSSTSGANSPAATGGGSGNKTLTYLPGVAGDNFYISVGCAAKAEASKLGYRLGTQAPAKWDVTLQRPILDAAITAHPDALIVTPTDETALQRSLDQAKAAGITIVLSDTTTKDPSVAVSSVSADNVALGAAGFKAIQQAHPNGGKVFMVNSAPGISTGDDRAKGFEAALKAAPGFTFVGQQFASDDNAKAAQLTAAALAKDPDIIGIFGTSGNETQGAATAVRQAGLTGKVTVVGVDAYPAQVKALQTGDVQALIAQDVAAIGTQSVLQAVNALEGKPVKKVVGTGSFILTQANLNTPQGQAALYKTSC